MKDTIKEEDMLIDLTKTEIERRLLQTEQKNKIMKEKLDTYEKDLMTLKHLMDAYMVKLKHFECISMPFKTGVNGVVS